MMLLILPAFALPQQDVLTNASAYATHIWTATSANQYADCSSDYESNYGPGTYTGLPYDWGGYMTLDEFDEQIADGDGAGSHSWHGILSCTAGVDCSGYLSKIWDASHISTSTLYTIADEISWSSIDRGDAINDAGSHVVMYTHLGEGDWPVFWEAAGSPDKVRINNSGGWSYVDGYTPYRHEDITEGSSTGTASIPRVISSLPFEDYWWTPGAASDEIDVYNCSDADESGPEVLYKLEIERAGTLTARVSDEDGVDIDVHILSSPDGDSCLGRDDEQVSVAVEPGTVWLALDTYVGSREFSGPYLLTVSFLGEGEEDTGGTTDTGEPAEEDTAVVDDLDDPIPPPDGRAAPGAMLDYGEVGACGCASGTDAPAPGLLALGVLALFRRAQRGTRKP